MPRPGDPSNRVHDDMNLPVPYSGSAFPMLLTGHGANAFPGMIPAVAKPTPWYLDFAGVFRRHGRLIFLTLLLSAACGFYVGAKFKTDFWTVEYRLRHIKQSMLDGSRSGYEPMALSSYADLLTSEDMLRPIADGLKDQLPPHPEPWKQLQQEIKVDLPRMADLIEIKVETANPQLAIELLKRLTDQFISMANDMKRTTILRHSAELFKQKIIDLDTQIARIERNSKEYLDRVNANVPIDKLEVAEIDSYHSQRRKTLLDLIDAERIRIKERKIDLESKITKLRRMERHYELKIATHLDVIDAAAEARTLQEQIKVNEQQIRNLEEIYRKVPVEYANSRIIELKTQKLLTEQDLQMYETKAAESKHQQVSLLSIDPQDAAWVKLRQRMLGTDSPEFEVFKKPTWPVAANSSNRKVLTMIGAATPLAAIVLLLGFFDHVRGVRVKSYPLVRIEQANTNSCIPIRDETALLSVRIQQWIVGDQRNGHSESPSGRMTLNAEPEIENPN